MKTIKEWLWWLAFIPFSLWVQSHTPGLDALVVGLIVLALEERLRALLLFLPLCILIQEGIGTQPFGASFLWYAAILILLGVLHSFVEGRNFFFVVLLALAMAPLTMLLGYGLGSLQVVAPNIHTLLGKSIVQVLFTPPYWALAAWTRRWVHRV
ncbi:MAG: hypothetical protein PHN64_00185 [Desulfovibrionaceae bacterium]|nr:hypothetical protein [Desulfovibrionaceae bacterium]